MRKAVAAGVPGNVLGLSHSEYRISRLESVVNVQ